MWLLMNKFIPRHYYILYNLYESYIDSLLKLYFSFIDPIHRYFKFVDGREMRRSLKTWSKQLNWKGEMNKHEWKASKATGERVERYTRKSLLSRKYIKIKFTALLRKQKRKKKKGKTFQIFKNDPFKNYENYFHCFASRKMWYIVLSQSFFPPCCNKKDTYIFIPPHYKIISIATTRYFIITNIFEGKQIPLKSTLMESEILLSAKWRRCIMNKRGNKNASQWINTFVGSN